MLELFYVVHFRFRSKNTIKFEYFVTSVYTFSFSIGSLGMGMGERLENVSRFRYVIIALISTIRGELIL